MELKDYEDILLKRLISYYDVEKDFQYENWKFPLYARFFQRNERYIASKKVVVYGIEQNEHIFCKYFEKVSIDDVREFAGVLEHAALNLVVATDEHMSTLIRGLIVAEKGISEEAIYFIKNYKFYKSFLFGLKGWVNIAFNAVDLDNIDQKIYNKMGKEGSVNFSV